MGATRTSVSPAMFQSKIYYIERDFTPQSLYSLAKKHKTAMTCYSTLSDYYRGKHVILERTFDGDTTKPNNKLIHNFPKLIVDNSVSYFMGKPVKYDCSKTDYLEKLNDVMEYNNETDVNAELAKMGAIYGHAYEVLWIDNEGEIRFKQVSPSQMFICYSMDITEEPLCAVSYRETTSSMSGETYTIMTVYTPTDVREFECHDNVDKTTNLVPISSIPHYFGGLPVIEYPVNNERIGDFETVLSLIDAYNLACSDSVNDVNYMNDAYLMLKGLSMSDETDVEDMKQNRILLVDGEYGDAQWLVKNINDTHIQNIKNRLVEDIHKFSMTPNLADEKFASNLSGVAISYKLIGLENKTAGKERKFATALKRRLQLITNVLNVKGGAYDFHEVDTIFTRNIPQNLVDITNTVASLQGIAPQKDLLALLPFITNPDEALKELEKEQEADLEKQYAYMNNEADYDMEGEDEQEDTTSTGEVPTKSGSGKVGKSSSAGNKADNKVKQKTKNNK